MSEFNAELSKRLEAIRAAGLHRRLPRVDSPQGPRVVLGGRPLLNLSSNDYLGLASDPVLTQAAIRGVEQYGAGAGASRLICGSLAPHHELEEVLAEFKGAEAALAFASGYATALGAITALLGRDDFVVFDRLAHACIVDAARLSGAKLRVFRHNDLNDLEDILRWADRQNRTSTSSAAPAVAARRRTLIITESLFSMDGDQAPLADLALLKAKYGAWLMVDEAHATGLYGERRRGLIETCGVQDLVDVQMGTLGKALGAAGGYICGSRLLADYLINRARSLIFSTAPVPAAAAAAAAGVRFVRSQAGAERCARLWERVHQARQGLAAILPPAETAPGPSPPLTRAPWTLSSAATGPIQPVLIGEEGEAVRVAEALREQGLFVPAIRYPTVARGRARLRVTLTANHTEEDVRQLLAALRIAKPTTAGPPSTPVAAGREASGAVAENMS